MNELMAMMTAIAAADLLDDAVRGMVLVREVLLKTGLSEENITMGICELEKQYTEKYHNMSLQEIVEMLGD